MRYYINEGNRFGKTFYQPSDAGAINYAVGYAYGKQWNNAKVYCVDEGRYLEGFAPFYEKKVKELGWTLWS